MTANKTLSVHEKGSEFIIEHTHPMKEVFAALKAAAEASSDAVEFAQLLKRSKLIQELLLKYGEQKRNDALDEVEKWADGFELEPPEGLTIAQQVIWIGNSLPFVERIIPALKAHLTVLKNPLQVDGKV